MEQTDGAAVSVRVAPGGPTRPNPEYKVWPGDAGGGWAGSPSMPRASVHTSDFSYGRQDSRAANGRLGGFRFLLLIILQNVFLKSLHFIITLTPWLKCD